jgi:hypothetical protein
MTARRPPMPEPPPRRRRASSRGERFKLWRVTGPRFPVTVTYVNRDVRPEQPGGSTKGTP